MEMAVCTKQPGLVVAFHIHSSHVGYDLLRAGSAFELIRNLNGNGVRFELSWFDVQPEKDEWDRGKIVWYKELCRETFDSFGITPIVNLAGTPDWAARLLQRDRRTFMPRWSAYCERAVEIMDGHVQFVQVWNEPNNPILQLAEREHAHVGIFNHSFFHDMLGVAAGIMRPSIRPLEILINVTSDLPNWERFVTDCIRSVPEAFDLIGLDSYRGLYMPGSWNEPRDLERLLARVNDPQDLWFGKQAALIEFGFSTFMPPLRGEAKQLEWANVFLTAIRRQNQVWQKRQAKSLRMISWYELFDEPRQWPLSFSLILELSVCQIRTETGRESSRLTLSTAICARCARMRRRVPPGRDPQWQKT